MQNKHDNDDFWTEQHKEEAPYLAHFIPISILSYFGGSLDQQTLHENTQCSQKKSESPTHTRVLQAQLHLKHSYLTYSQHRQDTAATQGNEVGI